MVPWHAEASDEKGEAMGRNGLRLSVVGVLVLAGAACGGGDGGGNGGGGNGGGGNGGAEADLVTSGTAFDPTTVAVASGGATITIRNDDGFAHTFTLEDGSVDQDLAAGETVEVEVNIGADTPFMCTIHESMTGTLTVA